MAFFVFGDEVATGGEVLVWNILQTKFIVPEKVVKSKSKGALGYAIYAEFYGVGTTVGWVKVVTLGRNN